MCAVDKKKVTMLCTPGLDSTLADYFLNVEGYSGSNQFRKFFDCEDIYLDKVYFDTGVKCSKNEVKALLEFYGNYVDINTDLDLKEYEEDSAMIPNRNLLFVTLAQAKYDSDVILINGVADDRVRDNQKKFFDDYSKILSDSAGKQVIVTSLFWDYEKAEILKMYLAKSNDYESLIELAARTVSCYSEDSGKNIRKIYNYYQHDKIAEIKPQEVGEIPMYGCMKCSACYRRNVAFASEDLFIEFNGREVIEEYQCFNDSTCPNRTRSNEKYQEFLKEIHG